MCLLKATKIIRQDLFGLNSLFNGNFDYRSQDSAAPKSTVAEKGHSQNIFHKSTNAFQIDNSFVKLRYIFTSTTIFLINQSFSNLFTEKVSKSGNLFQIDKKIKKRQIFFKSTKWLEIVKSFPNPQKKFKSVSLFQTHNKTEDPHIFFKFTK